MLVFVTGATGFIGSRIIPELLAAGHQVLGLTRSDAGARQLEAAGAKPHLGTLENPETLAAGAAQADAVIHTAFDHDFSNFAENCEKDRRVIAAMGAVLAGSNRPLIITSGVALGSTGPGHVATEDVQDLNMPFPRVASEREGAEQLAKGVSVAVVRLPQVHDTEKQGLITPFIDLARAKRVFAYVGDGANRLSAVHVGDAARLYRLALERHEAGARYHAVAEQGVAMRDIAEVIATGLNVPTLSLAPEQAETHFGPLALFANLDLPASSTWTRDQLDWHPTGPALLTDLQQMDFNTAA